MPPTAAAPASKTAAPVKAPAKTEAAKPKNDEAKKPPAPKKELTEKEKKALIAELLEDLANTDEQNDKRKLRSRLRNLGHRGGLPKEEKEAKPAKQPAAKKGEEKKPQGKRAAKAPVTPPPDCDAEEDACDAEDDACDE